LASGAGSDKPPLPLAALIFTQISTCQEVISLRIPRE
jgi:hypothetical protein